MQWARLTHNTPILSFEAATNPSQGKGRKEGRKLKVFDGDGARGGTQASSPVWKGAEDTNKHDPRLRGELVEHRLVRLHQSDEIMKTAGNAEREPPTCVRETDNNT